MFSLDFKLYAYWRASNLCGMGNASLYTSFRGMTLLNDKTVTETGLM